MVRPNLSSTLRVLDPNIKTVPVYSTVVLGPGDRTKQPSLGKISWRTDLEAAHPGINQGGFQAGEGSGKWVH